MKGYPIGGLVLWETEERVAYRNFLDDYEPGKFARQVEEGRWRAHKFLVYDGQQRLQTLRSVLYYTFNGRVLHFDLLFDASQSNADETGFLFRGKNAPSDPRYLKMTELVSARHDLGSKLRFEDRLIRNLRPDQSIDDSTELLIRTNFAGLWNTFLDSNVKSLAYFPVKNQNETSVNEAFRRLNIGGVTLTQVELVLGRIKTLNPDYAYEEHLWDLSKQLRDCSSGIEFSSAEILQFFHLVKLGTSRIDESRVNGENASRLLKAVEQHGKPLIELFENYLWGLFKINHASIVPRWLAVLPLAVYLAELKRAGWKWRIRELTADQVSAMNTYFLLAQFCDWNTQTMVSAFARSAAEAGKMGAVIPVNDIRTVAVQKNRTGALSYQQFLSLPWIATKVLTPSRSYVFHENKPQVDHIFPLGLADTTAEYREMVNVLWNLQPIPDGINNFKRAKHPKEFFNSPDTAMYWGEYDFIPEPQSPIWDDPACFIQYREKQMRKALLEKYSLELQ